MDRYSQQEAEIQLNEIGEWMSINGESVYGTGRWEVNHEGPFDLEMSYSFKIKSVQMLGCQGALDWELQDDGLQVVLPANHPSEKGYVLKITCK